MASCAENPVTDALIVVRVEAAAAAELLALVADVLALLALVAAALALLPAFVALVLATPA